MQLLALRYELAALRERVAELELVAPDPLAAKAETARRIFAIQYANRVWAVSCGLGGRATVLGGLGVHTRIPNLQTKPSRRPKS